VDSYGYFNRKNEPAREAFLHFFGVEVAWK